MKKMLTTYSVQNGDLSRSIYSSLVKLENPYTHGIRTYKILQNIQECVFRSFQTLNLNETNSSVTHCVCIFLTNLCLMTLVLFFSFPLVRHGDEDRLATLMGVMQAVVSFVEDRGSNCSSNTSGGGDHIRCITAGAHKFVFLIREHVILVAAVRTTDESMQQILLQLTYVYNQIVSILTLSQLGRIFEQRRNYDLRRLLSGAEKFLDGLIKLMETDASFLLGAVRCLRMDSNVRDNIAQIIAQNAKVKVRKGNRSLAFLSVKILGFELVVNSVSSFIFLFLKFSAKA